MLAGSIANDKLTNSAVTIAGNNISLGDSIDATTLRESLGLSNAMHFVGIATVAITDGSTTNPSISGYTTKQKGDVIIDKESAYEYVWTGSKWERLGGDGSYKTVQTAVDDPTASGNSSTFIKTISQDKNGVITATKATIANHVIQVNDTAAGTYNGNTAVTLNLKNGNGINITNASGVITFAHSNSVTAKTAYGSTATTASANGGTIVVTDVKYDAQGHITGSTDRTITLSQTTYTMAGLMGSTAKGSATLPVYWDGKAWATITSYGGKASTAGTADKVAKSLSINGKSFDGSAAIDVGTLGISYGGTGATSASAALVNLGAAAANHSHSEYLPLSGGNMTGYINWGNTANAGLTWTTDNGTQICLRPYSPANTFQLTMKVSDGDEFGAINVDTSGNITLAHDLGIEEGGTGASDATTALANLGALPLAGGTMTGNIDWGNAKYYGLRWTTDNGTTIGLRPYSPSNVFQLTMKPSGGTEFGAFNVYTDGKASFSSELTAGGYIKGVRFRAEANNDYPTYEFKANSQTDYGGMIQMGSTNMFGFYEYPKEFDGQSTRYREGYRLPEPATGLTANKDYKILTDKVPVTVAQGGTGGKTPDEACANIGALRIKKYSQAYDCGLGDSSLWLAYINNGSTCCQIDLWNGGALTVNGSIVATEARDNTFAGTLTVSNTKSAGGYVKIWEDNEGGNIAIGSKSGKEFQMDAYNDNLWRLYAYNDSGVIKAIHFSRVTGDFQADGALYCSGGKTVYHTGNIVYSSTQPTGSSGMIWLKPV